MRHRDMPSQPKMPYNAEELLVLVEVECGYSHLFWHSGMTVNKLGRWWGDTDSAITYWFAPAGLSAEKQTALEHSTV